MRPSTARLLLLGDLLVPAALALGAAPTAETDLLRLHRGRLRPSPR